MNQEHEKDEEDEKHSEETKENRRILTAHSNEESREAIYSPNPTVTIMPDVGPELVTQF